LDLAFCGSRPLRISWLIVGMKPFTFRCGKAPRLLCSTEKARNQGSLTGRLATRMLSNVQLLPGETELTPCRSDGRAHSEGAAEGQPSVGDTGESVAPTRYKCRDYVPYERRTGGTSRRKILGRNQAPARRTHGIGLALDGHPRLLSTGDPPCRSSK